MVIKDKFGRVIAKKAPNIKNKTKKVSKSRKPIKKKPPTRKQSFTECQMKYYAAEDIYNPMLKKQGQGPTLTDQQTIDRMKVADRWPIPEAIVGRQKREPYTLRIDSLIHAAFALEEVEEWGKQIPDLDAPYNSMESEDDFPIHYSDDSEEIVAYPHIPKEKLKADPSLADK